MASKAKAEKKKAGGSKAPKVDARDERIKELEAQIQRWNDRWTARDLRETALGLANEYSKDSAQSPLGVVERAEVYVRFLQGSKQQPQHQTASRGNPVDRLEDEAARTGDSAA